MLFIGSVDPADVIPVLEPTTISDAVQHLNPLFLFRGSAPEGWCQDQASFGQGDQACLSPLPVFRNYVRILAEHSLIAKTSFLAIPNPR